MSQKKIITPKEHHKQLNVCMSRPPYRQGRKFTAVKVYTINDESQHLLVFGVPSLKLADDLKRTCFKYGLVKSVKSVSNYPDIEKFTEVYHVHYLKLSSARFAKKKLDAKSFYGGVLHVCYAPELESIEETKAKLAQRRKESWKDSVLEIQVILFLLMRQFVFLELPDKFMGHKNLEIQAFQSEEPVSKKIIQL